MAVVGTDVKFGYPEMRHSIVPAIVMTGLQRQLGRKTAFELVSLGRILGAAEMQALGLANRVAEPGAVLEAALGIAEGLGGGEPGGDGGDQGLVPPGGGPAVRGGDGGGGGT